MSCSRSIVRSFPCPCRVIYTECLQDRCKDSRGVMGINLRKSKKLPSKIILPYKWLNGLFAFSDCYIS